ncbi:methyl-accepting chemotaxis protein [Brevundimonas sp. PAMC22021]|uniref:methyl-accepting chemotaxis protein n=1 Tax=Brevundimonas sp. PAMC22021 TaxID=2861285 RepID=UPI001C62D423|nr:methyl-accepting chemotaxis protein [Brevundimonas sp. PAMC22021]QYF87052.1 PAS domain S-box protein [Brevundimonas sp. PAMC22021]
MFMSKRAKTQALRDRRDAAEQRAIVAAVHRSQAVIEFELDGTIRTANNNFLSVVGYALDEVEGQHHRLFMDPAEAATDGYANFWARLNDGEFIAETFTRYGKNGRRVVIEASYNPIFDEAGKAYKVVKFATDVTAREEEREQRVRDDKAAAEVQASVVAGVSRALEAIAAGDLSFRIEEPFAGEYEDLRANFNGALDTLDQAMSRIAAGAQGMQAGASEISSAAEALSHRTERQAASLEETAAALDEITATVRKTAENAQNADGVVGATRRDADAGGVIVGCAVAAMGEIERSSGQINQIIGVIDEIAFQTSLLALNAGVEAARAGDAGRGFAVVASEVRSLAQRSAESAKEIKVLISNSAMQVSEGVSLVRQSGEALAGIAARIDEVGSMMGEIRGSTTEQATALAEVNSAVNQMDQVTQQNAAMVEESTAAALSMNHEANQLADQVRRFRLSSFAPEQGVALLDARAHVQDTLQKRARSKPRLLAIGGGLGVARSVDWQEF